jgi:transposase
MKPRSVQRHIRLVHLPGHTPELNPVEGAWRYLKQVELANAACNSLEHLYGEFALALKRQRNRKGILAACWRKQGYV